MVTPLGRTPPLHGPDQHPYGYAGGRQRVVVGDRVVELPAFHHRADCFFSAHLASYDAVRELLPSEDVQPLRWFDGRAAIELVVLRYGDATTIVDGEVARLAPYAELVVAAAVSRHPVPPGLPLLAPELFEVGSFVLDLPVTTAEARDLGRAGFGLPTFVADMEFLDAPTRQSVTVGESGRHLLTLGVRPGGRLMRVRRPWILYSSLGGALLETHVSTTGWRHGRTGTHAAELALGEHPVAQRLRDLEASTDPLLSATYLGLRTILPAGRPVGSARPWPGHAGADRVGGRYTVDYGGTGPVHQDAAAIGGLPEPVGG